MTIYSNGKSIELSSSNSSSSNDIYSTEEQVIGTWVNGKPIYRKVYYTTTPETSVSSQEIFSVADLHIDEAITIRGIVNEDGKGQYTPAPYYFDDAYSIYFLLNGANSIWNPNYMRCRVGASLAKRPLTVILEYTKTTDTATNSVSIASTINSVAVTSSPAELI